MNIATGSTYDECSMIARGTTRECRISQRNDDRSGRGVDVCYESQLVLTNVSAHVAPMALEPIGCDSKLYHPTGLYTR